MPKDEFDFEDPFELNGMALLTHEDTTEAMAECFIEEFLRMSYSPKQVLALFRNPQYVGPHLACLKRGEPFIRELIAESFARWGRPIASTTGVAPGSSLDETLDPGKERDQEDGRDADAALSDPMGAPIPKLNV